MTSIPRVLKMAALTLSDMCVSAGGEDHAEDTGEIRAFVLLATTHLINIAFVLMACFPTGMDIVGRNRNTAVFAVGAVGLLYYLLFQKALGSARREFGEDEVAAVKARQRWRLPVLLYIVISWLLFIGGIAIIASRGGTRS